MNERSRFPLFCFDGRSGVIGFASEETLIMKFSVEDKPPIATTGMAREKE